MIQTYNGRVQSGHFYPIDGAMVPDCQAAVLVMENETEEDICKRQMAAMRRFQEEMRKCGDEPVPEFERVKFRETFL